MRIIADVPVSAIQMDSWRIRPKTLAYANAMREGTVFPPVKVAMLANGLFRIRDGRHRVTAAKLCGRPTIRVRYGKSSVGVRW